MTKNGSIKILLVEKHPLIRLGLFSMINNIPGYDIAGEATTISDAVIIAEKENPKLVIMEINLENENGMELIPMLKTINPEIVILVLSAYNEDYYSERVLRLGARGYVMKTASTDNITQAIQTVMAGKVYLSKNERERIFEDMTESTLKTVTNWANSLRKLSDREFQIFTMVGRGLGSFEISLRLSISAKTIDSHKEHIKRKLKCKSSREVRQLAIQLNKNGAI